MFIRDAFYDPHTIPRHRKLSFEPCRWRSSELLDSWEDILRIFMIEDFKRCDRPEGESTRRNLTYHRLSRTFRMRTLAMGTWAHWKDVSFGKGSALWNGCSRHLSNTTTSARVRVDVINNNNNNNSNNNDKNDNSKNTNNKKWMLTQIISRGPGQIGRALSIVPGGRPQAVSRPKLRIRPEASRPPIYIYIYICI